MKFKTDGIGFWVCHKNDFVICQFFFPFFVSKSVWILYQLCNDFDSRLRKAQNQRSIMIR